MLHWFEPGKFPLYLAPMAGFTDMGFRTLCKEMGADVLVSEFVLADAVVRGDFKVWNQIEFSESQRPMGIQIFGSEPKIMARAAQKIVRRLQPDFIDLNFGCPARKVTCKNAGSSLLRDLPLLAAICKSVVEAVPDFPVTAKIRIGWDDTSLVAVEAGQWIESVGIQALAIHGRTRMQGYRGDANWEIIHRTAQAVSIPVIGNGSRQNGYDIRALRSEFGVSGLMIGRAALGNPWIFRQINAEIGGGLPTTVIPTLEDRWELVLRYAEIMKRHYAHLPPCALLGRLKPRIVVFFKEFKGARKVRDHLSRLDRLEGLSELKERSLAAFDLNRSG